jgi:hypothetical protein
MVGSDLIIIRPCAENSSYERKGHTVVNFLIAVGSQT